MKDHKEIGEPGAAEAERVLVLYDEPEHRDKIISGLAETAQIEAVQTRIDLDLIEQIVALQPSLLIFGLQDHDDTVVGLIETISTTYPLPIIVFAAGSNSQQAKLALRSGVSVYVEDGLRPDRLPTLVTIAKERFRLINALHDELKRSKEELAARKSIERAKGLLMERRNLSEREAYDAMRRMAMAQGKTVHAIADTILSISDILP